MAMSIKIPIFDPMCQECPHSGATYKTNIDSHQCHMVQDQRCVGHALTKKNVSNEVVKIENDGQTVKITWPLEIQRRLS